MPLGIAQKGETMVTQYGESTLETDSYGRMILARQVLCSDGKRRTARPSGDGTADTFFSIPARVSVKGKTVSGYVTSDSLYGVGPCPACHGGHSELYCYACNDKGTVDVPTETATLRFIAYSYGRNGSLLPGIR